MLHQYLKNNRTIFILLLVFFTGQEFLHGQRSLYMDAIDIANSKPEINQISIEFRTQDSVKISWYDDDLGLQSESEPSHLELLVLDTKKLKNSYTIALQDFQENDYLEITVGDSTISWVAGPGLAQKSLIRLKFDYPEDFWAYFPADANNPSFSKHLIFNSALNFFKEVFRLANYADFNELGKDDYLFSYPSLERSYRDNPFINLSDHFSSRIRNALQIFASSSKDLSNFFTNELYADYPYQKILLGDSSVLLKNTTSLATNSIGYRQQIIIAQDQLRVASDQFDEQRKKGGLFNVNNIAVGLSDFIAEQAQEELNLTFFNRFKENLEKDSELTKLFPSTKNLLFKFEISNYKTFLSHAREAFTQDLENLSTNLPEVLKLNKYQKLQNNPNIFNLALIYSISDLAYREQPVETILLAAHRKLIERQINLDRSINFAIADSLLNPNDGNVATSPKLQEYSEGIKKYLQTVEQTSTAFHNREDSLIRTIETDISKIIAIENKGAKHNDFSNVSLEDYLDYPGYYFNNGDIYNVRKTYNQLNQSQRYLKSTLQLSGKKKHLDRPVYDTNNNYYKNLLDKNLSGRQYYGWVIKDTEVVDFPRYFQTDPLLPKDYISQGIELSRELLEENYDYGFMTYQKIFNEELDNIESIRKNRINIENNNNSVVHLGKHYKNAFQQLHEACVEEMCVWWWATNLDVNADQYLAGLAFLYRRLTSIDKAVRLNFPESANDEYTKIKYLREAILSLDNLAANFKNQLDLSYRFHGDKPSKFDLSGYTLYKNAKKKGLALPPPSNPGNISLNSLREQLAPQGLNQFSLLRQDLNSAKHPDLKRIIDLRMKIAGDAKNAVEVASQRQKLISDLKKMERDIAPHLVKARNNAQSLTTAVELATHLLFAFRNYDRVYDTLFYLDTQTVEVTVQQVDPATGINRTYKKDSTIIVKTIVPGTDEAVTTARWLTREEFTELRQNERAWNTFLGLLYQRLRSVEGAPEFSAEGIALLATQFLKTANEIEEHSNELRRKHAKDPKSVTFRDHYPTIRSTVDLFNTIITAPALGDDAATYRSKVPDLELIPTISNEALSLYENIYVKNYGGAILNATELLKIITERELTREQLSVMTPKERKKHARTLRNVNAIFRYGTFMAEMINAQSSEQVKNILKSTTLPPGSSRIKREVTSSFTINAYLGLAAGQDQLLDAPAGVNSGALGAAASVPIGLTYSFTPWFVRNNSSFSFHVPLIDIGAVFAYRFNSNGQTANINNLPELEWKNLLSPGLYLHYNIANSPWSLGLGVQYGPQLREINQANGEPVFLNSLRFPMGSISFDLPFFSLYTGPKKIKVR